MKSAKIARIIARLRRWNLLFMVGVMALTTPFFLFASGVSLERAMVLLFTTFVYCGVFELGAWCWEVVFRDRAEYEAERDSKDR